MSKENIFDTNWYGVYSVEEVKSLVENNEGIVTVTMQTLRDTVGKDKLGVNVRKDISSKLAGVGLGHIPRTLPKYQTETVRLYKKGTAIGDLIDIVMSPGEDNDTKIKELFSEESRDYASIVEQIRELVSE